MRRSPINIADLRANELVRFPKQPRGTAGAGANSTPIRYAKLAQIVDDELRCFAMVPSSGTTPQVLAGDDLQTFAPINQVIWPSSTSYLCDGQPPVPAPQVGDVLEILAGPDEGSYAMVAFTGCRQAGLDSDMTSSSGGFNLPWRIVVGGTPAGGTWSVDYSKVFEAVAGPESPLHRYRPYMGPGDHTASDLVTTGAIYTHAGSAGQHAADSNDFTVDAADNPQLLGDTGADPPIPPVLVGDILEVLSGPEQGNYAITAVVSDSVVTTNHTFTNTSTGLDWQIIVTDPNPPPEAFRVTSAAATFLDPLNPVQPGMYIEITGGADDGRHLINSVVSDTELELATPMTADETGLSYRIDIVSEHATTLQLVPVGGKLVAVPDQDSVEVKIARAIRDENDAATLDTFRELGTTEAVDLFNELGAYLACYRVWVNANQQHGLPVDDRVIIAALPWRGRFVTSVLYFDLNGDGKYDLSDPDEPVWPIRWLRTHWRLEDAIAEDELQEPTAAEVCP